MRLIHCTADDNAQWDRAVMALSEASFFHLAAWRSIIEQCFGFRPHYIAAERDGDFVGLMPLYLVHRPFFGKSLMSVPLGAYGGAVAEDEATACALENEAIEITRKFRLGHLEVRNQNRHRDDWFTNNSFHTFVKPMAITEEENFKAIPRKQRAEVRKAIKTGLISERNRDLDTFFPIYARSVHKLGTPVFPKEFFQLLLDSFPDHCDIVSIYNQDTAVSSVLNFYFKNSVMPYYGGGLDVARPLNAFPFMYWELMRMAFEDGYRVYDFGRSIVGTGAFAFKKNWGFESKALNYQYCLVGADKLPNASPESVAYKIFSAIWPKLPAALVDKAGPLLSRLIV